MHLIRRFFFLFRLFFFFIFPLYLLPPIIILILLIFGTPVGVLLLSKRYEAFKARHPVLYIFLSGIFNVLLIALLSKTVGYPIFIYPHLISVFSSCLILIYFLRLIPFLFSCLKSKNFITKLLKTSPRFINYIQTWAFVCAFLFALFYMLPPAERDYDRLIRQDEIRPLIMSNDTEIRLSSNPRDFFLDEEKGELYVVSGGLMSLKDYVYKISLHEKKYLIKRPVSVGHGVIVSNETVYILDYRAMEIMVFNARDLEITKRIPLKDKPKFFVIDPIRGEIFVLAKHGELFAFDLENMNVLRKIQQHFPRSGGMVLDRDAGILFITHKGQVLQSVDVNSFEIIKAVQGTGSGSTGIALDNKRGRVIINYFMERYIDIYDQKLLEFIKRIYLGRGFRRALYDEKRDLLYLGDYFKGYLHVVDMSTGLERKRIFLCKKIRSLKMSRDKNSLLAASACGIIEVNINNLPPRH